MFRHGRGLFGALVLTLVISGLGQPVEAIPYFARKFETQCSTCHRSVPKLNQTGLDFRARGYRLEGREPTDTIPLAVWLAGGYERRPDADVDKTFINKLEIISGGTIGSRASYFAEWRTVSLGLQDNGELSDRSGRFEDLFVSLDLFERTALTFGQFRLFNQFDTSLRLSASTPLAMSATVPADAKDGDTSRQTSLRGFSPGGRSPAAMITYRLPNPDGDGGADGWYMHASVPFPGELSIPLTDEARERASFEFDGTPKGVFVETYRRRGLSSFGGAAFFGSGRQLYTGLVSIDEGRWNTTLALTAGVIDGDADRGVSFWGEYLPRRGLAFGFRIDESSFGPTGYHLYGNLQFYQRDGLLWLQAEHRFLDGGDRTTLQLSAVF